MCFCTVQICWLLSVVLRLPYGAAALAVVLLLCVAAIGIGPFLGSVFVEFVEIDLWHVFSIACVVIAAGLVPLAFGAHRVPVYINSGTGRCQDEWI